MSKEAIPDPEIGILNLIQLVLKLISRAKLCVSHRILKATKDHTEKKYLHISKLRKFSNIVSGLEALNEYGYISTYKSPLSQS